MIFFSSDSNFKKIYQAIKKSGFKVDLLITESPKEAGRGKKIRPNEAHYFAESSKIKVFTPKNLETVSLDKIKRAVAESSDKIGFVFAYGKILPQELLDIFSGNIFNLHPSLLPLYRGATPIQSALLDGVRATGYSVIKMNARLDAGDITYKKEIDILPDDDYGTLSSKIIDDFCLQLPEIISKIQEGTTSYRKQDEGKATYTRKFTKKDGEIKASDTAKSALLKIRAFADWPKAYLMLDATRLIIHKAHLQESKLFIDEIQKPSGKPMAFSEFKRGNQTLLTQMPDFVRM